VATGMTSTTIRSLLTLLTLLTLLLLLLFLPPRRPIDPAKSPPEPFPESNPTEPSSRSIRPPPTPIVLPDGTRASSTFRPFAPKTPATPRPREAEWNIPRRWCDWIKRSRSWSWRSWNRRGNRRGNRIPIIPLLLLMGVDRAEFDSASRPSIARGLRVAAPPRKRSRESSGRAGRRAPGGGLRILRPRRKGNDGRRGTAADAEEFWNEARLVAASGGGTTAVAGAARWRWGEGTGGRDDGQFGRRGKVRVEIDRGGYDGVAWGGISSFVIGVGFAPRRRGGRQP